MLKSLFASILSAVTLFFSAICSLFGINPDKPDPVDPAQSEWRQMV